MDSLFLDDWGHLSDSILNDTMNSIEYHEDLVSVTFEDNFSFSSLRAKMVNEDTIWLNATPFSTAQSDIPLHILPGMLQTLFDEDGTVNVDDTLLYIEPDGKQYYVTNGSTTILDSILNGTWGGVNSNVIVVEQDGFMRSSCKSCRTGYWKVITQGNYMLKGRGGFCHIFWMKYWFATSKSYKRKSSSSKFKKWKTWVSAGWNSNFSNKVVVNNKYTCGEVLANTNLSKIKKTTKNTFIFFYNIDFMFYSGNHDTKHSSNGVNEFDHSVLW